MKKLILILILFLTFSGTVMAIDYTSQYPTQDSDHVKATTEHASNEFHPYYATDPVLSVTGTSNFNSWISDNELTNQRFHIDLGSAKVIKRIYYENWHDTGNVPNRGVNNFTFWGSNTAGSFAELTYGTDTGWTELTVSQNTFDEHVGLDEVDPKYITVTNSTAYRYYACKFADNHGGTSYMGVRRIELQITEPYTSQYPTQDDDHVKSTSKLSTSFWAYFATDPALSLVGSYVGNAWLAGAEADQRFHIDLGGTKIIRRIYYENSHNSGATTAHGVNNFTFWGSNTPGSFAELTYGTDTGWIQLTTSQATFDEHVGANQTDPKYITVTNSTAYRYYAFKFADNHTDPSNAGVRRIELQTEDGWPPITVNVIFFSTPY